MKRAPEVFCPEIAGACALRNLKTGIRDVVGRPREQEWPSKAEIEELCGRMRLVDVGAHYGRSVGWVSHIREVYGLTRHGPPPRRTYDDPPLKGELLEMFLGSMLGDGCMVIKRESATHGPVGDSEEEWRDLVEFPGYRVSTEGRIMSTRRRKPRVLKGALHRDGYRLQVLVVTEEGRSRQVRKTVSHLVLETFVGPRGPGQEARHLNNDPADDRLANLAWGSKDGEHRRKLRKGIEKKYVRGSGRALRGSETKGAKLTEDDVRAIRASDALLKDLAKQYGVSASAIHFVKIRKTWKHVE